MFKITMYSTGCPQCNTLAKRLQGSGYSYTAVQDENEVLDFAEKHNLESVPILQVVDTKTNEEKIMNFSEAMSWIVR